MSETTILLIRHGHSEGNLLGVFTGHSGYPLTELGHKQAEMTGAYIHSHYNVNAVYCSDLPRAFQTAEHIAEAFHLPVITDARLREINAGEWENVHFTDLPGLFPDDYSVWMNDLTNSRCSGGESVEEVAERTVKALEDIAKANHGKCVAVVSHGTPIRSALWVLSGGTKEAMNYICWSGNCGVSELLFAAGRLKILSANYTDHLSEFSSNLPSNI